MNGQIFHRNNARIVRAQTIVKAYERKLGSVEGKVLFVRTHGEARAYNLATCGVVADNGHYKAKLVKSGKRMVRRIKF